MYPHRKTEALYSQLSSSTKTRVAQALQSSLQSLLRATHRPKFLYSFMWVVLVHGHSDLLHALSSTSTFCCGFAFCSAVSEAAGVATGGCDTGSSAIVAGHAAGSVGADGSGALAGACVLGSAGGPSEAAGGTGSAETVGIGRVGGFNAIDGATGATAGATGVGAGVSPASVGPVDTLAAGAVVGTVGSAGAGTGAGVGSAHCCCGHRWCRHRCVCLWCGPCCCRAHGWCGHRWCRHRRVCL